MPTLLSRNNPKIKQVRQLISHRKERDDHALYVVEGIHHVGEAIAAQAQIEYLIYAPVLLTSPFALQLVEEQEKWGKPCLAVDGDTFSSLAGKDNPQGILAVVRQSHCALNDLTPQTFSLGIALVAPQDPGNIGTILRTIDAVGASGLVLLDDPAHDQFYADPYHPSAVRASMGAIFWYPIVKAEFSEFVQWARKFPYTIYGTSAHARQDYRQMERFHAPLVLMMGSEREGLTPDQSAVCDAMLSLPMHGRVSSLNLAVATGVMLYAITDKIK